MILSRHSRQIEFLFAPDRAHQTKLSYFFGFIDFAPCDGEINLWPLSFGSRKFRALSLCREKRSTADASRKASSWASKQKQGVTNDPQTE
jgi:DICT domain-containing protein